MTATAIDRNTPQRDSGTSLCFKSAASVTHYRGAIGCLNASGLATPGATATTLKAVGRVESTFVDGAGDTWVNMTRGCFRYANSAAGDAITDADYGASVYIVDNQTVAKTNGTSTRSVAGICRGIDAQGVWVEF